MQGKLVRLRAYEKSDVEALMRWFTDEEVTDLLGPVETPMTRAHQERAIERATAPDSPEKAFLIETIEGQAIGDCGLRNFNWRNRHAELFITIGEKSFWGRGCGTDAVRLLLRLAFDKLNLHSVWLTTLATNARAIRCYEKCGFKRQGLFRENSYVRGRYVDVVPMGILRSEYQPG
jgi:RimJ/RimL family protein N-acetyltransferase